MHSFTWTSQLLLRLYPLNLSSRVHVHLLALRVSVRWHDQHHRAGGPSSLCPVVQPCRCFILFPICLWLITLPVITVPLSHPSRPPPPWDPDDCLMSRRKTMGSRCLIDGKRTAFVRGEALCGLVLQTHSPIRRLWSASWLQGWLMTPYQQCRREPSLTIAKQQGDMRHTLTSEVVGNTWIY